LRSARWVEPRALNSAQFAPPRRHLRTRLHGRANFKIRLGTHLLISLDHLYPAAWAIRRGSSIHGCVPPRTRRLRPGGAEWRTRHTEIASAHLAIKKHGYVAPCVYSVVLATRESTKGDRQRLHRYRYPYRAERLGDRRAPGPSRMRWAAPICQACDTMAYVMCRTQAITKWTSR
jgi:hypothetical protein